MLIITFHQHRTDQSELAISFMPPAISDISLTSSILFGCHVACFSEDNIDNISTLAHLAKDEFGLDRGQY